MGMIIRVAFNNQNWADRCINADKDKRLFQCRKNIVDTTYTPNAHGICKGKCWESTLCKKFFWVNKGNFGERAEGEVFFLFRDIDDSLVLWGKSRIKKVIERKVYFEEFEPLPPDRRISDLSYSYLESIGVPKWSQGTFRYLDDKTVKRLNDLLNEEDYFADPAEPFSDLEGRKKLKEHLIVERSSRLVKKFKANLKSYKCSICGFDFGETYGEIGKGFIEAHHKKPVSSFHENKKVSVNDFVAVCSNCHRMLHRKNPPLTIQELRNRL